MVDARAAGITVGVDGVQYPDGLVEPHIKLYDAERAELTADAARELIAALSAAVGGTE